MPLVEVTLVEGRDEVRLRSLIAALTSAVEESLGASRESIRVVLREVPATHWAAGGVTIAERRAAAAPLDGGAPPAH
ncbi:MAG: 4-oxalocrotonate tautomerase family protein [Actinomycetota bacterium]|jgi:4-oxalocrotonate tautomerase|nr:4-oxalocrotonate tautomerase family protein [Actinomycetota bacterium]